MYFKFRLSKKGEIKSAKPDLRVAHILKRCQQADSFEEAELVLQEGLLKYPQNAGLHKELAEIATRRKDWELAKTRWQAYLKEYPHRATAGTYVKLARALKEKGSLEKTKLSSAENHSLFEEAELVLREGLVKYPQNAGLHKELAEIATRRKDWGLAKTRWELYLEEYPHKATAGVYVKLARVLKKIGSLEKTEGRSAGNHILFEIAESILLEGLLKYPKNANLHKELADTAVKLQDWETAITRLVLVLEDYPEKATAGVYFRLSYVYKKTGNYQVADDYLEAGLHKFPRNRILLLEYAQIAYEQQRWAEAIKRGDRAIKKMKDNTPIYVFYNLYISNLKLGNKKEAVNYIRKSSSRFEIIGEQSYKALISGDFENSLTVFRELLDIVDLQGAEEIWLDTYHRLIYYMSKSKLIIERVGEYQITHQLVDKVLVSGMGWSGSGALYDYLEEFRSVSSIKNEFKHIRGLNILLNELKKANNNFMDELFKVFWFMFFGFITPKSKYDLFLTYNAKKFSLGVYPKQYALAVNYFVKEIINLDSVDQLSQVNFQVAASKFVDLLVKPFINKQCESNLVLFNNTIKISEITMVSLISRYNIFCTFRDPRSNYVALVEEKKGRRGSYFQSVTEFTENYRRTRKKYTENLKALTEEQLTHVHTVQFEDFVLSEKYRLNLARKVGLDVNDQDKFAFFKPWESEKNVYNYKDFHDQEAIKTIGEELPDYLYQL